MQEFENIEWNRLIEVGGPIVAIHECLIVTSGRDSFILWELNDDGNYDAIGTLPRACGGRFVTDMVCAAGDAANKLKEYIKCHTCNNTAECEE